MELLKEQNPLRNFSSMECFFRFIESILSFEVQLSNVKLKGFYGVARPKVLRPKVRPSHPLKKPCMKHRWHENLDENVCALVILL